MVMLIIPLSTRTLFTCMKHCILFLLLGASIGSFAQKPPVITKFYCMTGTIDKYPVTFLLHRTNDDFTGSYYYQNIGSPIPLYGKMDKKGLLELKHDNRNESKSELIQGLFLDSAFSGTWQSKGKKLNMRVTKSKAHAALAFDYIWTTGTRKIKKGENTPDHLSEIDYEAKAVWPSPSYTHPSKRIVEEIVRDFFGVKNSADPIGKIMLQQKKNFLGVKDDEVESYSESHQVTVDFADSRLLGVSMTWYNYTGGAHGMYGTQYVNVDLQNNRKLELPDVLDSTAAVDVLEKLLKREVLKNYSFEEGTKLEEILLVDTIPLTNNFLLTGQGIGFNYTPYEIAAYVYGEIFLFIPYKEIMPYLKPEFKKLMKLQ